MFRKSVSFAALVAVAAALTVAGPAGAMSHPKLTGVTGLHDAFVITLKNSSGKLVTTLKAGTYTFVIHDGSSMHSFALDGPHGFAKDFTTIPFKGTKTATVKLVAGKYKYYCANHESTMFHFFKVR
jgi:hypothetical protein